MMLRYVIGTDQPQDPLAYNTNVTTMDLDSAERERRRAETVAGTL